jgi:hypothetical protein
MRTSTFALASLAVICSTTSATVVDGFPQYINPLEYSDSTLKLFKRQGCPGGFSNCGALGNSAACCPTDQVCARDGEGNVACCPVGAACTGRIGEGSAANSATTTAGDGGGLVVGGTTGSALTSTATVATATSGFLFPSQTTSGVVPTSAGESIVPGAVFPFVFIPTTFSNQAECSSYADKCNNQYQSCLGAVGGGLNGVTVSGANVGVTVQGASATLTNANNACSSLSQRACYGLQSDICPGFGGTSATGTNNFVVGGAAAPRMTGCPGIMYALGAGAVLGVAGRGLL